MNKIGYMVRILMSLALPGVFLTLVGIVSAIAQEPLSIKEIVEKETASQEIIQKSIDRLSTDPLNRTTPRSTIIGIAQLMKQGKYEDAVEYLDMRYLPDTTKPEDGPRFVRQLQFIFSRNIWLDIAAISDSHKGHLDDGLPIYRDLLGRLKTSNGLVDL